MINFKSTVNKKNPLHYAAINGNVEISKFLLNCRININEIDIEKCFLGIIKKMLNSIQMSDDQRNELIHHLNEQI